MLYYLSKAEDFARLKSAIFGKKSGSLDADTIEAPDATRDRPPGSATTKVAYHGCTVCVKSGGPPWWHLPLGEAPFVMCDVSAWEAAFGGVGAPPSSDTGAQNTYGLSGCLDWIELTFPVSVSLPYVVEHVLGLDFTQMERLPRGWKGYRTMYRYGYLQVCCDGNADMGVHVIMSGKGVRQFEQERLRSNARAWQTWFEYVLLLGAHFTRLDLAIDDRVGYFTLEQVQEEIGRPGRPNIRSLFKGGRVEREFRLAESVEDDGERFTEGWTIYFGSRASNALVRMYDKAAQMGEEGFWLRTEVQLRDENAQGAAEKIAGGCEFGPLAAGILRRYLVFLDPNDKDNNKSRRRVATWWECFLGCVEKVRLIAPKARVTVSAAMEHVKKQYAARLAQFRAFLGGKGFADWLEGVLSYGFEKMTDFHWFQLEQERSLQNAV